MLFNEIMATASATSNRASVPLQIDDLKEYSVQVTFSGSNVVGTLVLQASNVPSPDNSFASTDWIDIDGSQQGVLASTNHMWNVDGAAYRWTRAKWTYTSGTGNIGMISIVKEPVQR